jgi:hypothetical protein
MSDTMTGEPIELPIACALGVRELGAQERRWTELVRAAGTGRAATPDGIELRFRDDDHHGVERELGELVAIERECCAWARWQIDRGPEDGSVVLRARASGDGAAVLQSLFLRDA